MENNTCCDGRVEHYPNCIKFATWDNLVHSMYDAATNALSNRVKAELLHSFLRHHMRWYSLQIHICERFVELMQENDPCLFRLVEKAEKAKRDLDNYIFDRYKTKCATDPMNMYALRGRMIEQ